jgi:hypothetical protein
MRKTGQADRAEHEPPGTGGQRGEGHDRFEARLGEEVVADPQRADQLGGVGLLRRFEQDLRWQPKQDGPVRQADPEAQRLHLCREHPYPSFTATVTESGAPAPWPRSRRGVQALNRRQAAFPSTRAVHHGWHTTRDDPLTIEGALAVA